MKIGILILLIVTHLMVAHSAVASCEPIELAEEGERILKELPKENFMISEINDIEISNSKEIDGGYGYVVQAQFVQVDFNNGKGERSYNRVTQMMFDKNCHFLPKNSPPLF